MPSNNSYIYIKPHIHVNWYIFIVGYFYCVIFFLQWNNHGYDVAKIFSQKFSFVSPVWLQIKRRKGGTFFVQGDHDIDQGIMMYNDV